jgi:NADH-quinone oxidoreductase subunit N
MPATFTVPHIEYGTLSPLLIVLGVATLGVLVEAFLPRRLRYATQFTVALLGIVAALVATILVAGTSKVAAEGAVAVDGVTLFIWVILLVMGGLALLLVAERGVDGGSMAFASQAAALPGTEAERVADARRVEQTEVFPLMMFALAGMLLFPASNDLLIMFVALEVLSLPLYLLCGLARRRRLLSQEAAMKYFLLGAFSSAFFLYGAALLYGYAGTISFSGIAEFLNGRSGLDPLLLAGTALVAVGLLFKIGAVPFHVWTPDVYQGAPTAITGFMAACTKIAAFGALLRLFYVALGASRLDWQPIMFVIASATMIVGAVLALTQSDIKRLLAYSSIAHAGFLLVGFAAVHDSVKAPTAAVLFYLATYGFATLGAFGLITLVRDAGGEATHLSRWAGLGKRSPVVAGVMTLFMLAFAGIPLTSGFMGKWVVFSSAWSNGGYSIVLVGVLASIIAVFFYLRVIVMMYFTAPAADGPSVVSPSALTTVTITVGAVATVVLGILPGPVLDLASRAASFVS